MLGAGEGDVELIRAALRRFDDMRRSHVVLPDDILLRAGAGVWFVVILNVVTVNGRSTPKIGSTNLDECSLILSSIITKLKRGPVVVEPLRCTEVDADALAILGWK